MGFHISCILARQPVEALARALDYELAEALDEMPGRGPWAAGLTASGYGLCWIEDPAYIYANIQDLIKGSKGGEILALSTCEMTMVSFVICLRDGALAWSVGHNGEQGNCYDLKIEGTPPDGLAAIVEAAHDRQRAEDAREKTATVPGDIPPEIAAAAEALGGRAERFDPGLASFDHGFDIPLEMVAQLTGFRHDQWLERDAVTGFHMLAPRPARSLLGRLLGRDR